MNEQGGGLYVHVPFCKTKCPYCDFYSVTDLTLTERWLRAVQREMAFFQGEFGSFDSLYIGGGTPSVLSSEVLTSLFEELRRVFTFADNAEITVEVNPDDITSEKLELLRALGVNRLSIGVQSFCDEELMFLGRRHSVKNTEKALHCVEEANFTNFGIDLMYGLPGQTRQKWIATLEKALTFQPTHISCYQLTIEHATPFGSLVNHGEIKTCPEEQEAAFFLATSRFLVEKGFVHYEISNFSRGDEFRSRHNSKYWKHLPYLGLGPGAHSFKGNKRWWNCRSVEDYCLRIEQGASPVDDSETLSPEQLRLEKLFLGLRTADGVSAEVALQAPSSPLQYEAIRASGLVSFRDNRVIPTIHGFLAADRLPLLFP